MSDSFHGNINIEAFDSQDREQGALTHQHVLSATLEGYDT